MRRVFILAVVGLLVVSIPAALFAPWLLWSWLVFGPLVGVGLYDYAQTSHAVLRNFPLIGHGRYLLELIRPEIYQYFIEDET